MYSNTGKTIQRLQHSTILQAAAGRAGAGAMAIVDNRQSAPVQAKKMEHAPQPAAAPQGNARATAVLQRVIQLGKRNKKKVARKKGYNSDEDDYVPPQGRKQRRWTFTKKTRLNVIRKKAHRRKHVNKNYKNVFTCPACRRPLASETKRGKFEFTKFAFTSKSGKKHKQVSSALDHYPPWAPRERDLKSRNATEEEMKEDYNDIDQLRALCKKCNESHKYENKKNVSYESDDDEEGYLTPDDEPENKGEYSKFRYRKDDSSDDEGGGDGILA